MKIARMITPLFTTFGVVMSSYKGYHTDATIFICTMIIVLYMDERKS